MANLTRGWGMRSLWPALLIVLLILLFSAALLREGRLRDMDVARLGSLEAATAAAEAWAAGETYDPPGRGVTGWGIYSHEGTSLVFRGTAPSALTTLRSGAVLTESFNAGTLRTIRTMAAGEPGAARGRRNEGGAGAGMRRLILIDWDIRAAGRPDLWRVSGATGLTLLAIGLLVMQQRSVRREARQKRLVQLGMAARTLTHEIRNPLGVLKAQEALLRKTLPQEFQDEVSVIGEEIDRLKILTDRVRGWLSDPRGNPASIDVPRELERILQRLPWPVSRDIPASQGTVLMDPVLFASAVENIIRNAVESTEGLDGAPPPDLSCRTRGRWLHIVVEDRGKGLPDVRTSSLFDPFFTTKTQGSGVGLALSRQLIEAAGGTLSIGKREGGGARAVIELPEEKN